MANRFRTNILVANGIEVTTDGINRLRVGNSGVLYSGENYGGFITNSNLNGLSSSGNLETTGTNLQNQVNTLTTNLNVTGSNSLNRDITLSGLIETSGTTLQNQITLTPTPILVAYACYFGLKTKSLRF